MCYAAIREVIVGTIISVHIFNYINLTCQHRFLMYSMYGQKGNNCVHGLHGLLDRNLSVVSMARHALE